MLTTYEAIATVTVGSGGSAGFDFTSIPSTYTDLLLALSMRSADAVFMRGVNFQFNGSSSSIYSYRQLYGESIGVGSYAETNIANTYAGQMPGTSGTASTFANTMIYVPNYAGSSNKSAFVDSTSEINSNSNYALNLIANLWASTSAINRVYVYPNSGNFAQHSTATLYGIKNS
jgi:hypothetical protein